MGIGVGIGTGFFSKMSSIQDENRKAENEYMMEDLKTFNEGLKVYKANKAEQQKQDNIVRGFAMQIGGDPRDTRALDVARTFVQGGHNITDPIVLAQAQQMYGGMKLKETQTQVQSAQAAQGTPQIPGQSPVAVGGEGSVPTTNVAGAPAQAPGLGGKGLFKQDMGIGNVITGKNTPEQLQAKSLKNIAGRTGFSPEQVSAIKTGQDTGRTDFNPESAGTPMDANKAALIGTAMKLAGDPGKLTDPAKFWQAVGSGNYDEAGKYIANAEQQNAWHIEASKIQAQASRDSANIHAAATLGAASMNVAAATARENARLENSPAERYAQSAAKLDEIKTGIGADPSIMAKYVKKYPGMDVTNPQVVEWVALQELRSIDTESYNRVIAGPNNKPPQGNAVLFDYRTASTPPGTKAGANDPSKGGSKTDPYATKTPAPEKPKSIQEEAKIVADRIKAIKDPEIQEKLKKEFGQTYPKYYMENFLPNEKK